MERLRRMAAGEVDGRGSERIGVFGGSFDPPHIGHQVLAGEAQDVFDLDKVLWVLTPDPPHKVDWSVLPATHRIKMVEIAIEGSPGFEFCRVDIDRPAPHYALDTLRILRGWYPQATLIYLIGGDSLRDLPTWHRPAELVAACDEIGEMRRPGDAIDLKTLEQTLPALKAKLRWMDAPYLEISSSDIRKRAIEGRPFRFFLPEGVYQYICQERLYQYN